MKNGVLGVLAVLACCLFLGATTTQALTPEGRCQLKRAKEKGKYEKCVQVWLAKCDGKGDCDDFKLSRCRVKYQNKWPKLQKLTGTTCDAPRFVDNEDGTVTDNLTGLVWEQKTTAVGSGVNLADPTDVDNSYDWTSSSAKEDGPVFTDFLGKLNFAVSLGGAWGWRIPTFAELQTILLPQFPCSLPSACIDPIFGPTQFDSYWSSTTVGTEPGAAWSVDFDSGSVDGDGKAFDWYVRAVRGGL